MTRKTEPSDQAETEREFLYKYSAISDSPDKKDFAERIFVHNELWLSSVADFNDPFDGKANFSLDSEAWQEEEYWFRLLSRKRQDLSEDRRREIAKCVTDKHRNSQFDATGFQENQLRDLHALFERVGVICFCKNRDSRLMWSHYAQGHKGFCLEFEVSASKPFFEKAREVQYRESYPTLNSVLQQDPWTQVETCLFTKSKEWEYESEFRYMDIDLVRAPLGFPPDCLTGVILGCRMTKEHRERLLHWIERRSHPVRLYEARPRPDAYALDIFPV